MNLNGKNILITGGTGSFGSRFVNRVLTNYSPERLVVLSRDELKQFRLRQQYPVSDYPNLRFFIGDVRDRERVYRAMDGIDFVIHAAALKQIPTAEINPLEAIKTNVMGAANIIDAALDHKIDRLVALSTDKAANPINLYGATKLCSDKLFVAANNTGLHETKFSVVRYGNVVGSRGSVIPYFLSQKATGVITITDARMTRFLITLDQGVDFVLRSLEMMRGGEIFVPKIPSVNITDLARVIAPECKHQIIGIRPGEKLHEVMVPEDDARMTIEFDSHFVIQPTHAFWNSKQILDDERGVQCSEGFRYSSEINTQWLSDEQISELVESVKTTDETLELISASEPKFIVGG